MSHLNFFSFLFKDLALRERWGAWKPSRVCWTCLTFARATRRYSLIQTRSSDKHPWVSWYPADNFSVSRTRLLLFTTRTHLYTAGSWLHNYLQGRESIHYNYPKAISVTGERPTVRTALVQIQPEPGILVSEVFGVYKWRRNPPYGRTVRTMGRNHHLSAESSNGQLYRPPPSEFWDEQSRCYCSGPRGWILQHYF